jgi:hypothetical protein
MLSNNETEGIAEFNSLKTMDFTMNANTQNPKLDVDEIDRTSTPVPVQVQPESKIDIETISE